MNGWKSLSRTERGADLHGVYSVPDRSEPHGYTDVAFPPLFSSADLFSPFPFTDTVPEWFPDFPDLWCFIIFVTYKTGFHIVRLPCHRKMKVSPGTAGTTERNGYREIRVVPPAGRGPFIHLKKWKKVRCQKSKICGKAVPYMFGFHYLCSIQDVPQAHSGKPDRLSVGTEEGPERVPPASDPGLSPVSDADHPIDEVIRVLTELFSVHDP